MMHIIPGACAAAIAAVGGLASAQTEFLLNDRTADAIWRIVDANGNGVIDEPDELNVYFNGANSAGTLAPMNPSCLAASADGRVAMGDQVNRCVYLLRDLNGDGDAQDKDESIVFADATNLSGASFAFPTGAAFGSDGRLYIVNAGNAFGDDAVYVLEDLTGDGDAQDDGEITVYAGAPVFGPGNGPYSPQELFFAPGADAAGPAWGGMRGVGAGEGFLRNSSSELHGVYRMIDGDGGGDIGDAGEFAPWFDASSDSPVAIGAGFPLEPDRARMRAVYTGHVLSGGVDQIIRAVDADHDGDAQGATEARVVYENAAAGFTAIDVVSLADGAVYLSDASAGRVFLLRDLDCDGAFMGPGESSLFFTNTGAMVGTVRQMAVLAGAPGPCPADLDGDGARGSADLAILLGSWGAAAGCADLDGDGAVGSSDLALLLGNWGACG